MCIWDSEKGCNIRPPPRSITFILLLAFFITIFFLLFDFFVGQVQTEYASKRPQLELWGLDSNHWLGSVQHPRERDHSHLADAVSYQASKCNERRFSEISEFDTIDISHISETEKVDVYDISVSPQMELVRLMERVEQFFINDRRMSSNNFSDAPDRISPDYLAVMKAISTELLTNFDGTLKPLTCRQKLFYHNRFKLIENKLERTRKKALLICKNISGMSVHDDGIKDVALMREFILEQVSFIYQFALRKKFSKIDGMPPKSIHPLYWILAWIYTIGVFLFVLYWVFSWGLKNNGSTLNSWGIGCIVAIVQKLFVADLAKVCIMSVFALMSVKPQLRVIKNVINDRALALIQDSIDIIDDVSVVQHFSSACRASRMRGLNKLPSSVILQSMTDADVERCKEHKDFSLGRIIFYIIMVAAAIGFMSELFLDQFLSCTISTAWLAFVLLNVVLFSVSPIILIVFYTSMGAHICYRVGLFVPSVKRVRERKLMREKAHKDSFQRRKSAKVVDESDTNIIHELTRRMNIFIGHITRYIGYISLIVSSEGGEIKREEMRYQMLLWCGMNKASINHGYVATSFEIKHRYRTSTVFYNGMNVGCNSSRNCIPPFILNMRQNGSMFDQDDKCMIIAAASASLSKTSSTSQMLLNANLTIWGSEGTSDTSPFLPKFITDPHVALKRMLKRHLHGADIYDYDMGTSAIDNDGVLNALIFKSELVDMLSWVWDIFYPGGVELTAELKSEVNSLFLKWYHSPDRLEMMGVWGVPFSVFSVWFLAIVENIQYRRNI